MNQESCHSCRYLWSTKEEDSDQRRYWCRRYPPRTITDPQGYLCSMFPEVTLKHWCGEFSLQPRPTAHRLS